MSKTPSMLLLQAHNIHKSYLHSGGVLPILKGIDFSVKEGEVVSIVGPSGAGKSTLLHIMGGLDQPNEGWVLLDDDHLYELNDNKRAEVRNRKIGFIFQFYHLLPEFTALENVVLPALIKERRKEFKKFKQQAMDLLEQVGLKERVRHKPYELSGGEQQRVAIARALMNQPKVILCDEPTGNLDSHTSEQIIHLLMDLNKNNNQTIVVVTHDESIARLSHRSVHVKDGELVYTAY